MNSLQDLNNYGNQTISFEDQRPPGVILDPGTPSNQYLTLVQGESHQTPLGSDITSIIGFNELSVYYQIDISTIPSGTISWPGLPSGVTLTNLGSGLYQVGPIISPAQWDTIPLPTIDQSDDFYGVYVYTARIKITNTSDSTVTYFPWNVTVNLIAGTDLSGVSNFSYTENTTTLFSGQPSIVSTVSGETYSLTITPSNTTAVSNITSSGSGGTTNFNSTSKVFTITGNKTQVNSHLATLSLTAANVYVSFVFTYKLTVNVSGRITQRIQSCYNNTTAILGLVRNDGFYTEGVGATINGGPLVTDVLHDGTGTYTYTVKVTNANSATTYVSSLSATGTGGSTSWNNSTKTLTITGNRTAVNTYIDNIVVVTTGDFVLPIYLEYKVVCPTGEVTTRTQVLYCSVQDLEIANMTYTRYYNKNGVSSLFQANVPYIDDNTNGTYYTISLAINDGLIGTSDSDAASTWTFTGTKTQCNSKFTLLKFWPNKNYQSNTTFVYTQLRDGSQTASITVPLNWTGTTTTYSNVTTTLVTSGTWKPDLYLTKYLIADVIVVGGGGGASGTNDYYDTLRYDPGGSGGGGGGVNVLSNQTMTWGTYNIVIGAGGTKGLSSYSPGPYTINLSGGNGGATGITGPGIDVNAFGGLGAIDQYSSAGGSTGGTSAYPFSFVGGHDTVTSYGSTYGASGNYGGGGGGAGGAGTNAVKGGNSATATGGAPGPGIATSAGTFGTGGNGRKYGNYGASGPAGFGSWGGGGRHVGSTRESATAGSQGAVLIYWHS